MPVYEYKVIPAPNRGEKARGAKTTAERFAQALTTLMNSLGRDGWEYVRAETLPCEERVGFTGKASTFQNMLVFRRAVESAAASVRTASTGPVGITPDDPPRALIASLAPEGVAPKVASVLSEPANAPPVGPARGADHAAE